MSEEAKPNLRHKAVALEYSDKQELPKISAKGAGYIAERILKLAEEHEVPIAEHTGLVDALSQLQVGVEMDS
ncbi:MAG: EscU/YscU/HrcU family type III secretion system export apparatus switch protein, partial [Bdellovibrionales bacterium]|nr:EscU/YscU/HrcU family type III secretion system export apparatus switch protein [Bdellovibrionales bacterium]